MNRLLRTPGRGVPPSGAQPEPGHWEPVITRPDPMSPGEWEALLAASLDEVEPPGDDEGYLDPEGCVLPPDEDLAVIEAETDRFAAERSADTPYLAGRRPRSWPGRPSDQARKRGPRGPELPGSADLVPGVSGARRAGSGPGNAWMPRPGRRRCTGSSRRRWILPGWVRRPRMRSSA